MQTMASMNYIDSDLKILRFVEAQNSVWKCILKKMH